ncbi:hypothetical protein BAE29_02935 [Acidithiobacillus caldus]|nr:hypothetical protein BAE28_09305 [Acidithiobacillus caldus]OFC41359.1 hypothetical protein BAE29_02935 [Acidithiobacillus caldus]
MLRNVTALLADTRSGGEQRLSRKQAIAPPISNSAGHLPWGMKNPDRLFPEIDDVIISKAQVYTLVFRRFVSDDSWPRGPELL